MIRSKLKRKLIAIGMLLIVANAAIATTFSKVQNVDFPFGLTAQTKNLIVHPSPATLSCVLGAQAVLKKATLYAMLDWKGDYTDASAAQYTVTLNITGYSSYPGATPAGMVSYPAITLVINKDQPQSYTALDITGVYAAVNNFEVTATYTRTGSSEPDVESVMLTNVYYSEEFEYNVALTGSSSITANTVSYSGTETKFSWTAPCVPAPDYEFQLLRLFNTSTATIADEDDITTVVDWSKALSIETGNSLQELKLTITEGTGYYLWRVRPIGNAYEGGFGNDRNWGDWTDVGPYVQDYTGTISTASSPHLFFYNQFDRDRNWIFSRSFIEGDAINRGQVNIGEAISYANGLQMVQQQQTRLQTADKIIASQTIYDFSGRPALTTMAAPLDAPAATSLNTPLVANTASLGYISAYIQNSTGNSYAAVDFDDNTNYLDPPQVDTTTDGTGSYYSYGNSIESNVPTASGYPFSRTLYMRDGTSKPKEQSTPGLYGKLQPAAAALADKHTIRNYNSSTTDDELIRVLGDEAPAAESVLKSITTDANNEVSISYVSKEGNTIATCLSNTKSPSLDALSPAATAFTVNYHINNNTPYGTNGLRAFKTIVLTGTTTVGISYEITPKIYDEACIDFCATCDYKVTIKIINNDDPDGTHPDDQVFTFDPASGEYESCSTSAITPAGLVTSVSLPAGSYTIERIIEANQVDPAANTTYPATPPAIVNTPYIDQYLKHIEEGMRAKYQSTDAVTVTVYNVAGGTLSTLSTKTMAGILSYLQDASDPAFNPDIDGLYAYLGITQDADPELNPDHFDITLSCGNIITLPVHWCEENECPVLGPNYPTTSETVYNFEKYYTDWYNSQPGHSGGTITNLFPQYNPGEFNIIVTNMISCGAYDACQLLQNFKQIYRMQGTIDFGALLAAAAATPPVPGVPTPTFAGAAIDYFGMFMSTAPHGAIGSYPAGAGYEIEGIDNTDGGLGCTSADLGSKYHPYRYLPYTDRCTSCENAFYYEIEGSSAAAPSFATSIDFETYFNLQGETLVMANPEYPDPLYPSLPATITLYPKNDFLSCIKNCGSAPSGTSSASTFAAGATASCEQACDDRYPILANDLITAYHKADKQVDGDPFDLVASGSDYIFGTTPHTPSGSDIQLPTIYCEVQGLVDACKTGCTLTVQSDGSIGSAAEHVAMEASMFGIFDLKIPSGGECPSGYTSSGSSSHSFTPAYYANLLNIRLAIEKANAPAAGFYWQYDDFLLNHLDASSTTDVNCSSKNYVLVHPDIPSYFDYDATLGSIVYYFNKAQAGVSEHSKHMYSLSSLSAAPLGSGGLGFIYSPVATYTSDAALAIDVSTSTTSYLIDNTFTPSVSSVPSPIQLRTLIGGGVHNGTPDLTGYNETADGYWKFELCPPVVSSTQECPAVCYKILPLPAIDPENTDISDELITYTNVSCAVETANELLNIINDRVNTFVADEMSIMRAKYHTQCVDLVNDDLKISFDVYYHHYTLYYYDRAGNLVKTVPPEGVSFTDNSSVLLTTRTQHPAHTLVTEYAYNSLGQLVRQKTPDGGESHFWYDSKARLRFSQNARQLNNIVIVGVTPTPDPLVSYTRYDELGRITEVGETELTGTPTDTQLDAPAFPATGTDITVTTYTEPAGVTYFGNLPQRYLQNRVSYSYTDKDGNTATTGDQVLTYYSYDPHGNVEWMIQDVPEIGRSYVGYEYDLISGSVIRVKYNEELPDKFFHRYTYDVDKRIKTAETSKDGIFWVSDAAYSYYLHGPLKRTVLGRDKVQGQDYVYTLNGWLKGLNHIDRAYDPGMDSDPSGNADVARDAYSMLLNYYHGDFMNNSSKFNADETSNPYFLHEAGRDLYNGNISSWSNNYDYEAITRVSTGSSIRNMLAPTGRIFHYDELNRITDAAYSEYDEGTSAWLANDDYHEDFSYDANGNIQTLNRSGYSDAISTGTRVAERKMDQMAYHYTSGTNQLDYVSDAGDNTSATRYTDIKNQSSANYTYDAIGNMITDAQEGISNITWNVYGKISKISKTDGTVMEFLYDAAGQRVYKKVYNTSDPVLTAKTSYYSLDASGNSMAIYSRENSGSSPSYTATFKLKEEAIYGSSRLGMRTDEITLRTAAFTSSTDPVLPGTAVVHDGSFNTTIAPANVLVPFLIPFYPVPLVFVTVQGSATSLTTGNTTVMATPSATALTGIAGYNSAEYEDDCGYVVLKSVVMKQYNGVANVPLVYGRNGALFNTVGLRDYYKSKSMFMRKPGTQDEYYYFTIGADRKPYYHVFNALTGATQSMNIPLDNNNYQYSMALIEDRAGPGSSQLYLKQLSAGGAASLVRFEITASGISAAVVAETVPSGETVNGYSELQVSPDGATLLAGSNVGIPTILGAYSTGGYLYPKPLSAAHIAGTSGTSYAYGANTVCRSFDYTPGGSNIITGGPHPKRVSSSSFALSGSFTFSYTTNGDIRRGKNGNVYLADKFSNRFFELKNVDASTWASSGTNLAVIAGTAGQYLTGGLSLNRHLIHTAGACESAVLARVLGKQAYELKDHLGNVRVVITDRKVSILVAGAHDHYIADISSVNDYYAFGMGMPGRAFASNSYRYGFNGKEKDDEVKGDGNQLDYGMRIYDPRLGRFLSVDPLTGEFPYYTPYQFASNTPIIAIDMDGMESNVQLNNTEIVDTKEESQAIVAAKYGKNALERSNPSLYFQNRQSEAITQTKAVLNVVNDGLIIAGGIATVVLTAGAGAPIAATVIGSLSGTMGVAGGSAKLVADVTGNTKASNQVPTSYFGGVSLMIELSLGDQKHLVSGTVSMVEGIYTWHPTDVQELTTTLQKAGYGLDAINNIISGVQLTQQFVDEFSAPQNNGSTNNTSTTSGQTRSTTLSNKEVKDIKNFIDKLSKKEGSKKESNQKKTTKASS